MASGMVTFLLAVVAATVIAGLVVSVPRGVVHTWVRRLVLLLLNLSPWTIGTWRSEFSKRETFFGSWLLFFLLGLAAFSLLQSIFHWGSNGQAF